MDGWVTRMKDVDIDIAGRTGQMDGSAGPSRVRSILRAKLQKSLFARLPPAYSRRAPISVRAALYTLHNDVYPVVPTGTIVPKVNI